MKRLLLCTFVLASVLLGGVVSASAFTVTYDFRTANLGGLQTNEMTVDGYTLQVQAFTAKHNTSTNPWTTTADLLPSAITWVGSQGLGVSNSLATGSNDELDTGIYSSPYGWQDFLSFKITNLAPGETAKYKSITYYGLQEWKSDADGEFSQARQSMLPGGVLQNAPNPLLGPRTTDQLGTSDPEDEFSLPDNFYNGEYWLLAGPRLSGIGNSGTAGAGDSFRIAELEITVVPIPGAVWLLASGLVGLAGLRRRFHN
jgi:hypothetical protein